MYLFKKVVFNCKRATLLSLKREEGRITLAERLELSYHLLYCDPCRRFVKQSAQLNMSGKDFSRSLGERPPYSLSPSTKDRIQDLLDRS